MSEPMTTVEIEDVLSSIRRLVSEDLRPTQRLVSAVLQKSAAKLILTPALRIVPGDSVAHSSKASAAVELQKPVAAAPIIEVEAPEFIAEILPVFGSVRQPEIRSATAESILGSAKDANFLATAMSRINGLTAAEAGLDSQQQRGPSAENIESVVASVGAAVGLDEWEVDGGDPAPQGNSWDAAPWTDKIDDATMVHPHPVLVLGSDHSVADAGITRETVATDRQADTQIVREAPEVDFYEMGADSIVFNQDMAAEPVADTSVTEDASVYIDEDILRGIVRDMIRQELQGALGERITSNVRKLVRAEINRALAGHIYDDKARA